MSNPQNFCSFITAFTLTLTLPSTMENMVLRPAWPSGMSNYYCQSRDPGSSPGRCDILFFSTQCGIVSGSGHFQLRKSDGICWHSCFKETKHKTNCMVSYINPVSRNPVIISCSIELLGIHSNATILYGTVMSTEKVETFALH